MPVVYDIAKRGNGLSFVSASSNRVDLSSSLVDFQYNTNFSISMYILLKSGSSNQHFISKSAVSGGVYSGWGLSLSSTGTTFDFYLSSDSGTAIHYRTFAIPSGVSFNSYIHLTLVKSGSTSNDINLYINNTLASGTNNLSSLSTTSINYTGKYFRIGARHNSGGTTHDLYCNSIIYNSRIYSRALTATEVTYLSKNEGVIPPSSILYSELIADWEFNEKENTTLNDRGPNTINGTLVNFTSTSLGSTNAWVNEYGISKAA